MLLRAVLEFFRGFNTQNVFSGLEVAYRGMAERLLACNAVSCRRCLRAGSQHDWLYPESYLHCHLVWFRKYHSDAAGTGHSHHAGGDDDGSGNAPFYAFVEMIPKLAHESGINPAYLSIPMLQASNLGRTISPVSGVVVAVAGMANISPFEVVKTDIRPVIVGLIVVIVAKRSWFPALPYTNGLSCHKRKKRPLRRFLCFNNPRKLFKHNQQDQKCSERDSSPVWGVAMAMLSLTPVHAAPLEPKQYGDFDRYVLALRGKPAFARVSMTAEGASRRNADCKKSYRKNRFLTVHGLWPGLPKSIAARGVMKKRLDAIWLRHATCSNMRRRKSARNVLLPKPGCHWRWRINSTRLCPAQVAHLVSNVTNTPTRRLLRLRPGCFIRDDGGV